MSQFFVHSRNLLTQTTDRSCPQICYQTVPFSHAVVRSVQFGRQWIHHVQVSFHARVSLIAQANLQSSSIVLWVSQNIEDDYAYNLAL